MVLSKLSIPLEKRTTGTSITNRNSSFLDNLLIKGSISVARVITRSIFWRIKPSRNVEQTVVKVTYDIVYFMHIHGRIYDDDYDDCRLTGKITPIILLYSFVFQPRTMGEFNSALLKMNSIQLLSIYNIHVYENSSFSKLNRIIQRRTSNKIENNILLLLLLST